MKTLFLALLLVLAAPALAKSQLYLVEFEANAAGSPTSEAQAIELLETLIIPSLESLAAERRIKAGGILVGARAGAFVLSAGSHEEVTELVRALPGWGVLNWHVTPMESFSHRAELEKRVVKELKAGQ
ncbi:hypothetical protein [Gallaecimonas sp. GXIMD4217]|uniref:hypothetical protein n=1 Tax=Gallaecimonas sp. GXIMD4217 TaxID=3131927 RepID=UPI00311B42EE